MGSTDTITKQYMRRNDVFADVFIFLIYDGEPVIDPAKLTDIDTTELAVPYGGSGDPDFVQKYRDVLKSAALMTDDQATYLVLGIENQSTISFTMPVRNMIYDALQYGKQIQDIADAHKRNGYHRGHSSGEYLSGFYAGDRLTPVITLVVYFGADEWTAPLSLRGMMDVRDPRLSSFIQDYRINLIGPAGLSDADLEKFTTDFRYVMSFLKASKDKAKMAALFESVDAYKHLNTETALLLKQCAKIDIPINQDSEVTDMCQAWQDMANDCRAEGRAEGEARGRAAGRTEGMAFAYYEMVRSGFITSSIAAAALNQSESAFNAGLQKYIAGLN